MQSRFAPAFSRKIKRTDMNYFKITSGTRNHSGRVELFPHKIIQSFETPWSNLPSNLGQTLPKRDNLRLLPELKGLALR